VVEEISGLGVFSDTATLIKHRSGLFFGVWFALVAIALPSNLTYDSAGGTPLWAIVAGGASFFFEFLAFLSITYRSVNDSRGIAAGIMPVGVVRKLLLVFWKSLIWILLSLLVAVIPMIVIGLLLIEFAPSELTAVEVIVAGGLLSAVFLGIPLMRYSFPIVAAVMGERVTFMDSWRMSKGHSLKFLAFVSPLFIIMALSGILSLNEEMQPAQMAFPAIICVVMSYAAFNIFSIVSGAIWYERLRERYVVVLANNEEATKRVLDSLEEKRKDMGIKEEE